MGVFDYDYFPGMVVHDIIGWDDDGDCKIQGGFTIKASALIAVFPKKQGEAIGKYLQIMQQKKRDAVDKLNKELLEDFFETFPALQKPEDD